MRPSVHVMLVIGAVVCGVAIGKIGNGQVAKSDPSPSPLIYPPQAVPLAFDHGQHARLGPSAHLKCEACHAAALTSTSAGDNLIPGEAACRPCHAIDRTLPFK